MKLKTLPLFSLNQFFKIIFIIGLGSLYAAKANSQTNNEPENPGVIESLERLLDVHHQQFQKNKSKIQSDLKILTEVNNSKDIKIDPQFMRSLIFHSEERYFALIQKDECKFLSVLENNLLKTSEGEVSNILVTFKNKENKIVSAALPKNDFFEQVYKKKCLNNQEYSTLFSEANLQKTMEGIKFSIPKNSNDCNIIYKDWIDNSYTPYLCKIQQILKKSKNQKLVDSLRLKTNALQRTYLDNLCSHLNDSEKFCADYLKSDVWNKIINGEMPNYKLSFKCQNLLNKADDVTNKDLKNCAAKLITEPTICETKGNKDFPSNFPMQNCDLISDALNHSKLITNYHDCPGNVENEAITNIHRIVNHFSPRNIVSNKETCSGEASYSFARLNFDIKHDVGWPLKVCYLNHVKETEECLPYIPGSRSDEPLSEDQVIAKILYHQKGAAAKTKCKIVDSKTYNPLRSEFKFGCFIVYNSESCTTGTCEKKVIWEEKTQQDIHFIGKPSFDYFPTSFLKERYSFVNMLNELKGTQSRTIKNLTDLKFFLDKISNGIIHGVGCAEDLIPEESQRIVLNQCHPMPFIIDGYQVKNNETWLVLRSAIDDLHSPRLTLWQNIFNSVSSYRELHPLNTWALYGIKK